MVTAIKCGDKNDLQMDNELTQAKVFFASADDLMDVKKEG